MAAGEKTLTDEQFATISVNVLHQTLIEVSRTVGKRIFRELEAGTRVALPQLREPGALERPQLRLLHERQLGLEERADERLLRVREQPPAQRLRRGRSEQLIRAGCGCCRCVRPRCC